MERMPEPFETETMAELCARQGRLGEAVAIYDRLLTLAMEPATRVRFSDRRDELAALHRAQGGGAQTISDLPIPGAPGVLATVGDGEALLAWAVPAGTTNTLLEVLLVFRSPSGVETERRAVPIATTTGRLALPAPGLHSVVAAVGVERQGVFVPLARSPRG